MNAPKPFRATLLADGGSAASSGHFYRSPEYLRAERVSHSLVIEGDGGSMALPLIVRSAPGGGLDATSPYGYPGGELRGLSDVDAREVDWSATGLVSVFVRERLPLPHSFSGGTERAHAQLVDPARPFVLGHTHRARVAKNAREGMKTDVFAAATASPAARAEVLDLYRQTMVREHAASRYFFSESWFADVMSHPSCVVLRTRDADGAVLCTSLLVESDGQMHVYLTGTAEHAIHKSPSKTCMVAAIELAASRALVLNLGGGMKPGDGIESFKRGFANGETSFYTQEIVCDPAAYARLCAGRAATTFFPAYRAPAGDERVQRPA